MYFLFKVAGWAKHYLSRPSKHYKEIHPTREMHLNVNRNNKALQFYQHLGMEKVAEGDFI